MAGIILNNRKSNGKSKPKRMNLRVDFTPMVDMNMLLITFFMFCTTLSIPKVMEIVVPTKEGGETKTIAEKTITLILGEEDKVYYYSGLPNYSDHNSLKVTNYGEAGIRNVLLDRNSEQLLQIKRLKRQLANHEISKDDFKKQVSDIRKSKDGLTILIKPTDNSSYRNLVDVLDEMEVCNISKYAIVNIENSDRFLMDNYKQDGALNLEL